MQHNPHKCLAGCGKTITWRFAICSDCERIYGSVSTKWPDWLRYLWQSEMRERRSQKNKDTYEVSLSVLEDDDNDDNYN